MTTRRSFLAAGAALAAGVTATPVTPASAATPGANALRYALPVTSYTGDNTRPAIFIHAHQDDETLTLGPAIEQHARAGREIITVLATDGAASGARAATGLSVSAFSASRDREYAAACNALGADRLASEHARDGALSYDVARAIVDKWVLLYPDASFKCQSFLDSSPDHAMLGWALRDAWLEDQSLDVRFYLKRDDWHRRDEAKAWFEVGGDATIAAAREYMRVDPAAGRYGIGYRSVGSSFNALLQDPRTLAHKPF